MNGEEYNAPESAGIQISAKKSHPENIPYEYFEIF